MTSWRWIGFLGGGAGTGGLPLIAGGGFGVGSVTVTCDQVAILNADVIREGRAHHGRVVPGQFGDRVRHFLEPAVVDVTAIVHRVAANEHDLG